MLCSRRWYPFCFCAIIWHKAGDYFFWLHYFCFLASCHNINIYSSSVTRQFFPVIFHICFVRLWFILSPILFRYEWESLRSTIGRDCSSTSNTFVSKQMKPRSVPLLRSLSPKSQHLLKKSNAIRSFHDPIKLKEWMTSSIQSFRIWRDECVSPHQKGSTLGKLTQ
jgi:hypothetical protein